MLHSKIASLGSDAWCHRRPIVGVMGPGESATAHQIAQAYQLGAAIAQAGWTLLTGGRAIGVMQAATQGAAQAGGLTIGILPGSTLDEASPDLHIPIMTGLGQGRNVINVLSSQVVIACGFGAGTLAEIALAVKAQRPVILFATPAAVSDCVQELSATVASTQSVAETIAIAQMWLNPAT